MTSRLRSCPVDGGLRANANLARLWQSQRPVCDRLFIPLRPFAFPGFLKELSNDQVLIVNGSLGIDGNELEDHSQRLVLLNHTADELLVALEGIVDVRHI